MASPITVGTAAIVVAPINTNRSNIRFQNTSSNIIYIKKIPLSGAYSVVSATDYEVQLFPASSSQEGGEAFETNSIASFMAIAATAGSALAVYETNKV
jgi:hypothetical protein